VRVPIVRRQTDYYCADELAERETETDQNPDLGASTLIYRFSGSTKCPLWAGMGVEFIKDLPAAEELVERLGRKGEAARAGANWSQDKNRNGSGHCHDWDAE